MVADGATEAGAHTREIVEEAHASPPSARSLRVAGTEGVPRVARAETEGSPSSGRAGRVEPAGMGQHRTVLRKAERAAARACEGQSLGRVLGVLMAVAAASGRAPTMGPNRHQVSAQAVVAEFPRQPPPIPFKPPVSPLSPATNRPSNHPRSAWPVLALPPGHDEPCI